MFFWNSLAFSMIQRMLTVWCLVPLPFLNPAWTSGRSRFTYCWNLSSVQFSCSVMSHSLRPHGLQHARPPVHHQLLVEFTQTHVHWVGDAIQPSHPLSSPSPPAPHLSQHQGLFKWVSTLYSVFLSTVSKILLQWLAGPLGGFSSQLAFPTLPSSLFVVFEC